MDKRKLFEYAFGCVPEVIPERVIITPFLPLPKFSAHCLIEKRFRGKMFSGAVASDNTLKAGIIRCGVGDRLLGDAVLLLGISGAEEVVFTGSCASIGKARIGDLVVAESAADGEGFTRYCREGFDIEGVLGSAKAPGADAGFTSEITAFLEKEIGCGEFFLDKAFTIGSLLAEKRQLLDSLRENGIGILDMELSAVYSASQKAGIKATSLLWVSDLPVEKPFWEEVEHGRDNGYNKGAEEAVRLAVKFIFSRRDYL
ncbi:MAG: hypothetical protein GF408_08040 [Candidatus Omnitrophica bacterium]|nr:hypothetical protein [Candidatus Omnitrophota bacterium]